MVPNRGMKSASIFGKQVAHCRGERWRIKPQIVRWKGLSLLYWPTLL